MCIAILYPGYGKWKQVCCNCLFTSQRMYVYDFVFLLDIRYFGRLVFLKNFNPCVTMEKFSFVVIDTAFVCTSSTTGY